MSKAKALKALKRRRMQAQMGYRMHLLETYFRTETLPGGETHYLRIARKAEYRKELVRP